MTTRAALPVVALLLALAGAGCTAEDPPVAEEASPFAGCADLSAPLAAASVPPAPSSGSAARLPDLDLPCFTGGQAVGLAGLRGPAVINIWASWCEPCREELPIMQRLADRAAGRVRVVGVDTGDSRDAAASFGADRSVSVPTLYDRDRMLIAALGRATLPVTVFLDADGRATVHPLPLDEAGLFDMVRATTGVAVAP